MIHPDVSPEVEHARQEMISWINQAETVIERQTRKQYLHMWLYSANLTPKEIRENLRHIKANYVRAI